MRCQVTSGLSKERERVFKIFRDLFKVVFVSISVVNANVLHNNRKNKMLREKRNKIKTEIIFNL